jgi:hypothetical protein
VDALRSWEITQVNEMLTWMEEHALPFACTTNLLDRLDRASLRRFLVKVRFDWLTQAQARLAFRRFFGVAAPAQLDGLLVLTPADFSLVRRRAALTKPLHSQVLRSHDPARGTSGKHGALTDPLVMDAIRKVTAAARANGKFSGVGGDSDPLRKAEFVR